VNLPSGGDDVDNRHYRVWVSTVNTKAYGDEASLVASLFHSARSGVRTSWSPRRDRARL